MTSLEFIEKEIKYVENEKNIYLSAFKEHPSYYGCIKTVEQCEKKLQTLHQIKTELEAWEVVKPHIEDIKAQQSIIIHNVFENKHYQIIKKALEVKDD